MLKLDYDAIHRFVEGHPGATWDGFTVELFKPHPAAEYKRNGARRDGRWGYLKRISPNEQGKWVFRA